MPLKEVIGSQADITFHFNADDAQLCVYLSHKIAFSTLTTLKGCFIYVTNGYFPVTEK